VRHRPCTFLQESQRYCRYDDGVTFIEPIWFNSKHTLQRAWEWTNAVKSAETRYKALRHSGLSPQESRLVLPNSTKTELILYASLPEWQHIFKMRCAPGGDPEYTSIMIPLREEFKAKFPHIPW
jgi:thymidylate synthase (FAD)